MLTGEVVDIRKGEELPDDILRDYLQNIYPLPISELVVKQFSGGYSNLTYLLIINNETEWVLRKPPKGAQVKSGHDMFREYNIMSQVKKEYPFVPETYHFCGNHQVIGSDFYLMEKVNGFILRAGLPESLLPDPEKMFQMFHALVNNFVSIHNIDYKKAGLEKIGNPEQYVQRQITGWTKRYAAAMTDDVPEINKLIKWLEGHMPPQSGVSLIHNDYKYDNLMYDSEGNIKAVLDWEMSTIGDPLMDLGSSLAYWTDSDDPEWFKAFGLSPTTVPGNPGREKLVQDYATFSGRDPGNAVFYFTYGLLKLAVIAQQIYKRYVEGYTKDPRFANLLKAVKACGTMANQAIYKQRISQLF